MTDFYNTDKYIRIRQMEPEEIADSWSTVRLSSGVKAITGFSKGSGELTVQSVIFDKDVFSEDDAEIWLGKNKDKIQDALMLERQKDELFAEEDKMMEIMSKHMDGHLPPLTDAQIERLLQLAGPAQRTPSEMFSKKFGDLR